MLIALACVSCAIFVYALLTLLLDTSGRDRAAARVAALQTREGPDSAYRFVQAEKKEKKRRERKKIIRVSKQLEDLLAMSGVRLNANEYIYGWLAFTFLPMLLLYLCGAHVVSVIAGGIVGFSAPPLLVRRSRAKRRQQFNRQLGDCLVIMSNCLRSGFSFQQAMESIAQEMQPPVSVEFARVIREMQFGVSMEDALGHMSGRVKSDELDLLISAVLTSAQVGANLVDILEVCTATVNDRIKIKDDIRVLSAQGRTSGAILSMLPVFIVLALMFINPDYLVSFFDTEIGKLMIVGGLLMECVGFLVIRKLVDIRY